MDAWVSTLHYAIMGKIYAQVLGKAAARRFAKCERGN